MLADYTDRRRPRHHSRSSRFGRSTVLGCMGRAGTRLWCPGRRPGAQRRGGQQGSATVELAVLFPAFLVLVFGGVQAAQWYHVRSLCLAAADAGVQAGRKAGAGEADASRAASGFLAQAGGGTAEDPIVATAGSSVTQVRVVVSASVPRVLPLPGLSMRVIQSAQGVRERFTVPGRTIP